MVLDVVEGPDTEEQQSLEGFDVVVGHVVDEGWPQPVDGKRELTRISDHERNPHRSYRSSVCEGPGTDRAYEPSGSVAIAVEEPTMNEPVQVEVSELLMEVGEILVRDDEVNDPRHPGGGGRLGFGQVAIGGGHEGKQSGALFAVELRFAVIPHLGPRSVG